MDQACALMDDLKVFQSRYKLTDENQTKIQDHADDLDSLRNDPKFRACRDAALDVFTVLPFDVDASRARRAMFPFHPDKINSGGEWTKAFCSDVAKVVSTLRDVRLSLRPSRETRHAERDLDVALGPPSEEPVWGDKMHKRFMTTYLLEWDKRTFL